MQSPSGQVVPVTVVEITEEEVTLAANHPLAGKALTYAFESVSVN
jgi:peptidylprolyl isomerase